MGSIQHFYVVDKVPDNMLAQGAKGPAWYVHLVGLPHIPVFGSIGTKKAAEKICALYNLDGKVHYV